MLSVLTAKKRQCIRCAEPRFARLRAARTTMFCVSSLLALPAKPVPSLAPEKPQRSSPEKPKEHTNQRISSVFWVSWMPRRSSQIDGFHGGSLLFYRKRSATTSTDFTGVLGSREGPMMHPECALARPPSIQMAKHELSLDACRPRWLK